MFRPGDAALVRSTGEEVTVVAEAKGSRAWIVRDLTGEEQSTVEECDLQMAHPSVLASIRAEPKPEPTKGRWSFLFDFDDPLSEQAVSTTRMHGILRSIERRDLQGHWRNGLLLDQRRMDSLFAPVFFKVDKDDAEALLKGSPLDRWVPVVPLGGMEHPCPNCDMRAVRLETDGRSLRVAGPPCPFPDGVPSTEWELNVPSGRIVVANDLRDLFPLPRDEDDDYDIGTTYGRGQTALAYAAVGMSHASVGNTSPGVYRVSGGRYRIATSGKNQVATVRTALWWYSICDHAEFERRCARFKQEPGRFKGTVVEVPPGVYRFEHRDDEKTRRGTGNITFATFHRVRDPDPVVDLLRSYEEVEVNAHAYVRAKAARWPTLYAGADYPADALPWDRMTKAQQDHAWREVALQTLFVGGNGVEWHERGFPRCQVDPAVADAAPPKFRAQYRWGQLSDYGLLGETPIREPKVRLSASFARLAFECLESTISFGVRPDVQKHQRDVADARREMRTAVRFYRNLLKEHPDGADPTFARWVTDGDRAEAWVERFDLGPEMLPKHHEYLQGQRWVPEGTFAVEFDARKLTSGSFARHPKRGGHAARKEDADRCVIERHERDGFWYVKTTETSVPLYVVARVVKLGEFSHMGRVLVEVEFDYGTEWMRDRAIRKALREEDWKEAIRPLTRDEYAGLLPAAAAFYRDAERAVGEEASDDVVDTSDWKVLTAPPAPVAPPDADWHLEPDEVKP